MNKFILITCTLVALGSSLSPAFARQEFPERDAIVGLTDSYYPSTPAQIFAPVPGANPTANLSDAERFIIIHNTNKPGH